MDEVQKQRAIGVIASVQCALDRGVQHFDRNGKRLISVSAIIEAWARGGGLTIKEPEHRSVVANWITPKRSES